MSTDTQAPTEPLMTEQEAARLLSLSPATLRLYRAQKRIEHFKFARRVAYAPAHIEAFKQRHLRTARGDA